MPHLNTLNTWTPAYKIFSPHNWRVEKVLSLLLLVTFLAFFTFHLRVSNNVASANTESSLHW